MARRNITRGSVIIDDTTGDEFATQLDLVTFDASNTVPALQSASTMFVQSCDGLEPSDVTGAIGELVGEVAGEAVGGPAGLVEGELLGRELGTRLGRRFAAREQLGRVVGARLGGRVGETGGEDLGDDGTITAFVRRRMGAGREEPASALPLKSR